MIRDRLQHNRACNARPCRSPAAGRSGRGIDRKVPKVDRRAFRLGCRVLAQRSIPVRRPVKLVFGRVRDRPLEPQCRPRRRYIDAHDREIVFRRAVVNAGSGGTSAT